MNQCMICKGDADLMRSFITIRTLNIRSFGGVKRVQGVGEIVEGSVCNHCIHKEIDKALHPFKKNVKNIKKFLLYGFMFVMGILLALFVPDNVIRVFGAAATLCGILCCYGDLKKIIEQKRITAANSEEQNNIQYSLALTINSFPKKKGDEDLTYIPLDKSLTKASLGDLCLEYKLLPEIAKEVRDLAMDHFTTVPSKGLMEAGEIL